MGASPVKCRTHTFATREFSHACNTKCTNTCTLHVAIHWLSRATWTCVHCGYMSLWVCLCVVYACIILQFQYTRFLLLPLCRCFAFFASPERTTILQSYISRLWTFLSISFRRHILFWMNLAVVISVSIIFMLNFPWYFDSATINLDIYIFGLPLLRHTNN